MEIAAILVITLAGYLLGSIPNGFLVARAKGVDIRQHGSGNIGATNVFRTLGKTLGIFVFFCDALKGVLAVLLACWLAGWFHQSAGGSVQTHASSMPGILGGIACILGHNFPVWLKFKGGKGMATSAGVLFTLMPYAALICMAVWFPLFFATRYVSLASIFAAAVLPVVVWLLMTFARIGDPPLLWFSVVIGALAILRHRSNIQRLLNGTENRFKKK
jgi:glycerol-3-phosphate acyltransferase PlsY